MPAGRTPTNFPLVTAIGKVSDFVTINLSTPDDIRDPNSTPVMQPRRYLVAPRPLGPPAYKSRPALGVSSQGTAGPVWAEEPLCPAMGPGDGLPDRRLASMLPGNPPPFAETGLYRSATCLLSDAEIPCMFEACRDCGLDLAKTANEIARAVLIPQLIEGNAKSTSGVIGAKKTAPPSTVGALSTHTPV